LRTEESFTQQKSTTIAGVVLDTTEVPDILNPYAGTDSFDFELIVIDAFGNLDLALSPLATAQSALSLGKDGIGVNKVYEPEIPGKLQVGGDINEDGALLKDKYALAGNVTLEKIGALGKDAQAVDSAKFSTHELTEFFLKTDWTGLPSSGWVKLPNGLIIQCATLPSIVSGGALRNFPVAFPNAVLGMSASADSTLAGLAINCVVGSLSQYKLIWGSGTYTVRWIAIG
jgi:hypothetical protein